MTAGDIYTIAGGGTASGDGGLAISANIYLVNGVAVDGSGDVFIADELKTGSARSARPTSSPPWPATAPPASPGWRAGGLGQAQPANPGDPGQLRGYLHRRHQQQPGPHGARRQRHFLHPGHDRGDIYTIAGTGTSGFTSDGVAATSSELAGPQDVAIDHSGNLLIADTNNGRVRMVPAASGIYYTQAMTGGDIYTIAGGGSGGDGVIATSALLGNPHGLVVDGSGNVFIAEYGNPSNTSELREVAASNGFISTLTTDSGGINQLALDGSGNIDYASGSGQIKQVGAVPAPVGLSPAGLSFSNQYVGLSSQLSTTVKNTGLSTLSISSVTVTGANSGDFVKAADTCTGANLAVNASCSVTVTFTPTPLVSARPACRSPITPSAAPTRCS